MTDAVFDVAQNRVSGKHCAAAVRMMLGWERMCSQNPVSVRDPPDSLEALESDVNTSRNCPAEVPVQRGGIIRLPSEGKVPPCIVDDPLGRFTSGV
jgi:hypothetical protein